MARHWKTIPEEVKDRVVEMTAQGYTAEDISESLEMGLSTVGRIRKERCVSSARHRGGRVSSSIRPQELKMTMKDDKPNDGCVILGNKTIQLVGVNTGFIYTASTKGKDLKIETAYSEPFVIDIKDLVNFSNELLSVAETVERMRKNVFEV